MFFHVFICKHWPIIHTVFDSKFCRLKGVQSSCSWSLLCQIIINYFILSWKKDKFPNYKKWFFLLLCVCVCIQVALIFKFLNNRYYVLHLITLFTSCHDYKRITTLLKNLMNFSHLLLSFLPRLSIFQIFKIVYYLFI